MSVSAHLLLAALLAALVLIVVVCEPVLRRQLRRFRPLQLLALAGGLAGVPLNIFYALPSTSTGIESITTLAGSIAVLVAFAVCLVVFRIDRAPATEQRRILAIGAHPDDLELACGGTLAKLADSGHEIRALVMSDGSVGGDSLIRLGEARTGGRYLGVTACEVVGLPDTELDVHMTDMIAAIEQRVRRFNPDIILTHSSHDQHQDHAAVHLATLRAGRNHSAILCYESPSATAEFKPQVFVDIDDYLPTKVAAIAAHANQSGKPYMGADVVTGAASFRGRQARRPSAEGFEAVRVMGFEGVL